MKLSVSLFFALFLSLGVTSYGATASEADDASVFSFFKGEEPYLASFECEPLVNELKQIAELKANIDYPGAANPPVDASLCLPDKEGQQAYYRVSLRPFLTSWLAEIVGKKPASRGPNCFGAAMAAANFAPFGGGIYEQEASAILSSPLCRQIPENMPERPGDILAIYSGQSVLPYHVMTYLSKHLVFQKLDDDASGDFQIGARSEAFLPARSSRSINVTRYTVFRCQPWHSFVQSSPSAHRSILRPVLADIFQLSSQVAAIAMRGEKDPDVVFKLLRSISRRKKLPQAMLQGMGRLYLDEKDHSLYSQIPMWFWKVSFNRLDSLVRQLEDAADR